MKTKKKIQFVKLLPKIEVGDLVCNHIDPISYGIVLFKDAETPVAEYQIMWFAQGGKAFKKPIIQWRSRETFSKAE